MNELNRERVFLAEDIFSSEELRVVKSRAVYEFLDGVKTEKRIGTYVLVVDLANFDKYEIKMPLGNEITEQKNINISDFVGFSASLYTRNNRIFWSLKADALVDRGDLHE